jgi:co-chaperonin GroES (HSP10)
MINGTGIKPVGVAILVKPYTPEKSMIIMVESSDIMEDRAIVLEIGSEAWKDESRPRAKPGDKVMLSRFAGKMVRSPVDGNVYRLVNDRDIICQIVNEEVANERAA